LFGSSDPQDILSFIFSENWTYEGCAKRGLELAPLSSNDLMGRVSMLINSSDTSTYSSLKLQALFPEAGFFPEVELDVTGYKMIESLIMTHPSCIRKR
jgi:hypothetical protein